MAAWLALGKDRSVVSHDSALDLLALSDVIPGAIHLTVPRSRRHLPKLSGTVIHTTTKPPSQSDLITREGIRLTAAARTILDVAEAGSAPEQVENAIGQALHQGLVTPQQLRRDAEQRNKRVFTLVTNALATIQR
jgi:predicted transcriptional regulator of viral defense system